MLKIFIGYTTHTVYHYCLLFILSLRNHSYGLVNSMIKQVMLSAPKPSDVARFEGHILSIIISIILDITTFVYLAGSACPFPYEEAVL
jgi:hypothetical protein